MVAKSKGFDRGRVLFVLLCTFFWYFSILPAELSADIGPPVKIRLIGDPRPAEENEPYSAAFEITVGVEAELTEFKIEDDYWTVQLLDAPHSLYLKEKQSFYVSFVATPTDPSKPLILRFMLNDKPVRKAFDLSEAHYDRMINPPGVESLPGSDKISFPQTNDFAENQGRLLPTSSDETAVCQQILAELKIIRYEIENLKQQVAELHSTNQAQISGRTRDALSEVIRIENDEPVAGDRQAPLTLISFIDYGNISSRKYFQQVFPRLRKEFIETGKVRYVTRVLPSQSEGKFPSAAVAAWCAGKQNRYWPLHDLMFQSEKGFENEKIEGLAEQAGLSLEPFRKCLTDGEGEKQLEKTKEQALEIGVEEIPAFIIGRTGPYGVDDWTLMNGYQEIERLEKIIRQYLLKK